MANISGKQARLLIGSADFSSALISFHASDSHLDQSGLISCTGEILLGTSAALTQSLDDRKNPTAFCRGTTITIQIPTSTGTLTTHPRGALRILSPKYDVEKQQLTLAVGDLISLLHFKEPTDSVGFDHNLVGTINSDGSTTYTDPILDYLAGADRPLGSIITALLNRAGISGYEGSVPEIIYNNPLQLSGSYLESVGKLLYANNLFGWIDSNEIFQIRSANIYGGGSGINLTIGQDEIWYRRLDGAESPCEIVKAAGTGTYVYPAEFTTTTDTQYAAASSISSSLGPTQIPIRQTTKSQVWNPGTGILTTTTTVLSPIGLIVPTALQSSLASLVAMAFASVEVDVSQYESALVGGKLRTKTTTTSQLRATYYSEFQAAVPSAVADLFALSITGITTANYIYDSRQRLQQIQTNAQANAMTILNGTGEDWTQWTNAPDYLVPSQIQTQTWTEVNKGTWDYVVNTFSPLVKVNSSLVSGQGGATSGPTTNKLSLIYAGGDNQESNAGQYNPPAAERRPPDVRLQEANLLVQANFAEPCPTVLRQRERTFQVDFLAGTTVPNGAPANLPLTTATNQLQAIAEREGLLLWGRYKGQEIASWFQDEIFNYYPLIPVVATEIDGTIQNYLADGASWVIGANQIMWSCDGIWVGSTQGGYIIPYVSVIPILTLGQGVGAQLLISPFDPIIITASTLGQGVGAPPASYAEALTWNTLTNSQWDDMTSDQWDNLITGD